MRPNDSTACIGYQLHGSGDARARSAIYSWPMRPAQLVLEELTRSVIGAFYEVYNTLGFGFLEHMYVMALERELLARGHRGAREVGVRVFYKGEELGRQRIDMIVDDNLVVEIKAGYELHRAARRQVYNYLRGTNLEVGLVLHFGPEPKADREYCPSYRKSVASAQS